MEYNVEKLTHELIEAGLPCSGVSIKQGHPSIFYSSFITEEQRIAAQTIVLEHTPTWYKEQRRNEYPPVREQIDAFFHDVNNSPELIALFPRFYAMIKRVKDKYPKPEA